MSSALTFHHRSTKSHAVCSTDHAVQFYDSDSFLCKSLNGFAASGLQENDGVVVIATQEHCEGIQRRLNASGIDVARARRRGQLTLLDAKKTLAQFMDAGLPDSKKFLDYMNGLLEKIAQPYASIRVYSEMVNILWAEGNKAATIALEKLWNTLAESRAFFLLCGYQMNHFNRGAHGTAFQDVCRTHSHVIPTENFSSLRTNGVQQRYIAELQQQAEALKTEVAELKAAENALRKSQAELLRARDAAKRANLAKSGYLIRMQHQLRNHLSAILGFAELILDPKGVEDKNECAQFILRNGRRVVRILDENIDVDP